MKIIEIKKRTTFSGAILSLIFYLFATTNFNAQENISKLKGVMSFTSELIDYGNIAQNSNGVRVFSFTNMGNAPIVISRIKTTCGCTVPSYKKTAILPGETSDISIKYATNRIGAFSKSITVFSNAKEGRKILKVKGLIEKLNSKS